MLTGAAIELKTCNAAVLEATGKSWEEVKYSQVSLSDFVVMTWQDNLHVLVLLICYNFLRNSIEEDIGFIVFS